MAATKGAMTTLSSSQTAFLPTVEEPENNRINFRDSLKFFQEQLVINGANFPSPSSGSQSGNNTLKRNGSISFKENSLDKSKTSKDNDTFKEEIQSTRSCKIDIPTVDTILESVRVLRAIQKSQEERGSFWNIDVSTKSDIESYFHYRDDDTPITNEYQNGCSNREPDKERHDETDSTISEDKQAKDTLINQVIAETEIKVSQLDSNIETHLEITSISETTGETCSFWPSNSIVINSYPETENKVVKSPLPSETESQHVNPECYKTDNESFEVFTEIELNMKSDSTSDGTQHDSRLSDDLEQKDKYESLPENSTENECKLENIPGSNESQNSDESLSQLEQNDEHKNLLENVSELKNELNLDENNANLSDEVTVEQKDHHENLLENVSELKNELNLNENNTNLSQLQQNGDCESLPDYKETEFLLKSDSNFSGAQNDNEITSQKHESDNHNNTVSEIFRENETEIINTVTKVCDTPESLSEVCTELVDFSNFSGEDTTKEILLNELNPKSELLKIETYEDTDIHKPEVIMLNESLWKDSYSPNDRSSIKTEPNDSDSGFGTQRSRSSLSPNNHSQMQRDSWSDSCSSQYASAECSPYHSLSSVFECSSLLSTVGETKATENVDILSDLISNTWEDTSEKLPDIERVEPFKDKESNSASQQSNNTENILIADKIERDSSNDFIDLDFNSGNAELDTEISYCNFIPNYTIENPCKWTDDIFQTAQETYEIYDNSENDAEKISNQESIPHEQTDEINKDEFLSTANGKENEQEDDSCDLNRTQKFTATCCDLISIVQSLYTIKENPAYQILPTLDEPEEEKFEEELFVLSRGEFCEFPEDNYLVSIEDSTIHIKKDSEVLCSLNMKYGEVSMVTKTILEMDNKMGKFLHIQCNADDLMHLKTRIKVNILKHWQTDCLQLVHYPLKCHQNVVIIDLGSCSTRAGILMDQPTLPSLFFPTICATNKTTTAFPNLCARELAKIIELVYEKCRGTNVYGMEALHSEVRQHSNLSFPVRPTIKITKHTIDIDLLEGLFKKIFCNLKVDPTEYTIQVCLPRNLSINAQTALMKLLLEDLKVKAVSLTNQALLTLYAHEVSTAVVVDIGDRIDVLPVVDGFIVETGVTKLPHGGQRLIHHMKHGLAEKRISLSNDIDSFVVQYIIENLAYVAEDYEKEMEIATQYPDRIKKTVTLQPASSENLPYKTIALEEARFKITEGLFNPDFWGLDSPGIHHLVQKAIQATSVDARKQIAENIYVSGGVTMLPGFVERLSREMIKLSKTKIVPKVHASNYRYHCTYIGACKFAKMGVFPQVCVNLEDYSKNGTSVLKKCALCF